MNESPQIQENSTESGGVGVPTDADFVTLFASMKPVDLVRFRMVREQQIAREEHAMALLDAELARRYGASVDALFAAEGKQSGTVSGPVADHTPGGIKLKLRAARSKSVSWDQGQLFALAEKMPWDQARHWFDFSVKMPEKKYDGLPPGALRDAVTAARTVKYGANKIELVVDTDDAAKVA